MKFIAAWVRRNIDNKPDYISYHQYTIGYPVLYNTYDDALVIHLPLYQLKIKKGKINNGIHIKKID